MDTTTGEIALLRLLQLTSPALPVGAYSYSEGLETLVQNGQLLDPSTLLHWLSQELQYGAIRMESAVMLRAYRATQVQDLTAVNYWNRWLSAARETEELREQSWQMGRSLFRLVRDVTPIHWFQGKSSILSQLGSDPCNFAIAFGVTAAEWGIPESSVLLGYLQTWAANLVSAGVRLVPLGQTMGQQVLLELQPVILQVADQVLVLKDDALESCGWGLALSSMLHETQYSRLFRS